MNITKEELGNRITLYAVMSRLMMSEVDSEFLESIESNEALLNLFPNYKNWDKRKVPLPHRRIRLEVLMKFDVLASYLNRGQGDILEEALVDFIAKHDDREKDKKKKDNIDIGGMIG